MVVGAAYNAPNNSLHKFRDTRKMHDKPDRFDMFQDIKDALRPAPTSYKP